MKIEESEEMEESEIVENSVELDRISQHFKRMTSF